MSTTEVINVRKTVLGSYNYTTQALHVIVRPYCLLLYYDNYKTNLGIWNWFLPSSQSPWFLITIESCYAHLCWKVISLWILELQFNNHMLTMMMPTWTSVSKLGVLPSRHWSGILGTFYFYDGFKLNNSCKIHFHAGVVGNSDAMLVSIFTTS